METMVRGVKLARRILSAPPLADVRAREALPGEDVRTDDDIRGWLRERTATVFHPVGSCRMGGDVGAVVDPELRFRGLGGLRIADASTMPRIVSGNTNAAAMMIAEKAADMIRAA
jgi:choline dehydrogenase-like flavoprotein